MLRLTFAAAMLAGLLSTSTVAADDPADLAFWTSVRNTANPAELQAYIATFPQGRFVELARIRLQGLLGTPAPPPPVARPTSVPNANPQTVTVSLVPTKTRLRIIDSVVVDLDARALASGSNHRLMVVPAGTPDAVADPAAFANASTGVPPSRTRVSLPIDSAGRNEVRLYYIPQFGSTFVVAARTTIEVEPGYPDAVLVSRLAREAGETEPVRFEAKYRDQTLTVQGQFLRVQPRSIDELGWSSILRTTVNVEKPYVAMFVGRVGAEHRTDGPPTELLCLMPAEDRPVLDRVAKLNRGDTVVLQGTPSAWQSVFGSVAVLFNPCAFAPSQ